MRTPRAFTCSLSRRCFSVGVVVLVVVLVIGWDEHIVTAIIVLVTPGLFLCRESGRHPRSSLAGGPARPPPLRATSPSSRRRERSVFGF
jgi:hypothetical protein